MAFPDRRVQPTHSNPQFASWEVGVRYDIEKYATRIILFADIFDSSSYSFCIFPLPRIRIFVCAVYCLLFTVCCATVCCALCCNQITGERLVRSSKFGHRPSVRKKGSHQADEEHFRRANGRQTSVPRDAHLAAPTTPEHHPPVGCHLANDSTENLGIWAGVIQLRGELRR